MNLKAFLALMLLVCMISPALGQTPTQPPTQKPADDKDDVVKINTNLVQVDAVVTTKDGKPVTNLTADDFEIFEDGKRQAISSFAFISNVPRTATPAPATTADTKKKTPSPVVPFAPVKPNESRRTMAFVVDDLGLSAESMHHVKRQLRKFIAEELQPNDLVAIIRTSGEMGALQQFTNDRRILNRAVDQLRWNICSRVGIHVFQSVGPTGNPESPSLFCGFGSTKASLNSLGFIVEAMGYLPGRKSMVLLSDDTTAQTQEPVFNETTARAAIGNVEDQLSDTSPDLIDYRSALEKIAEKAIRSSVVIYSVDTQGLQYTGPTAADNITGRDPRLIQSVISARSYLQFKRREGGDLLARQTGGFQIRNNNNFEFDRILEDQSGYYLIGYRPTDETFNRSFHHIKAKVKRSGMSLRTRFGFFGLTEEEAARIKHPSTEDLTNLALASPFVAQDIEVDMTSFFIEDTAGAPVVRSFVYIDAKNLTFTPVNGQQQASIELHGVVFGDNGKIVEKMKRGATLNLSERDYTQAVTNGVALSFDMPVKRPGAYQTRLAVRDRPTSRMGSAGQFVSVPDLKNKKPAVSGIILGLPNADKTVSNAGGRRFRQNDDLYFAYNIYNAANESGQLRNLVMNATVFRDEKRVYSGPEIPIAASDPKDLTRVFVHSLIKLTPDLEPGNYYLQVVVTDKDAKNKAVPVVQWIDFEIEK